MERHFIKHRADFERLVQLFQEDATLTEGPFPGSTWSPKISKTRRERYERLYRRLGVRKIERDEGVILIRATTTHTFDRKGYAWCAQPAESTTCDGETRWYLTTAGQVVNRETTGELRYQFRVFRQMAPGWYIYFQANS